MKEQVPRSNNVSLTNAIRQHQRDTLPQRFTYDAARNIHGLNPLDADIPEFLLMSEMHPISD
jgi:hypothetical protein